MKHRHPLPALHVGGVDPAVLAAHADVLGQEVDVTKVEVLLGPERHVNGSYVEWQLLGGHQRT